MRRAAAQRGNKNRMEGGDYAKLTGPLLLGSRVVAVCAGAYYASRSAARTAGIQCKTPESGQTVF